MLKIKLKVELPTPVSGQQIAEAVKQLAEDRYAQELVLVTDDGRFYQIREKRYPCGFIIGVGSDAKPEVSMEQTYSEVYVFSELLPVEDPLSPAYIDHNIESIIKAVEDFRDELQTILRG